ncbi:MAG: MATE family efflux transporter [Bacteroidales bacterium]|nr:MATE family efflux transporter [Bacteroidales bacterium]
MNKSILKLAIPNIISNITIPLLSMVDMILMGHLESASYIGAIALGGTIFSVLYSFFSFLRAGTTGFTAQALGSGDKTETIYSLYRSVCIGIPIIIFILSMQIPIAKLSSLLLDGSEEVKQLAISYFYIRIWAAPANIMLYCLNGWFVGMQNTKIPMFIAILINVMNIVFSIFFVLILNKNVTGVALGTVISQYSGLTLAIVMLIKNYKSYFIKINKNILFDFSKIKRFFKVNTDLMIRSFLLIISIAFFTNQSAKLGDNILAVNMILLQSFYIFSYFTDGFAYAGEALVGKYVGSKDRNNLVKAIRLLLLWGFSISVPFTILYAIFPSTFVRIISDNPNILLEVKPYYIYMIVIPIITFAAFIWDGIYIGATASKAIRNTMIIATIFVFLPAWYLLTPKFGNHGLWIAFLCFMIARGVSMSVMAKNNIIQPIKNQ